MPGPGLAGAWRRIAALRSGTSTPHDDVGTSTGAAPAPRLGDHRDRGVGVGRHAVRGRPGQQPGQVGALTAFEHDQLGLLAGVHDGAHRRLADQPAAHRHRRAEQVPGVLDGVRRVSLATVLGLGELQQRGLGAGREHQVGVHQHQGQPRASASRPAKRSAASDPGSLPTARRTGRVSGCGHERASVVSPPRVLPAARGRTGTKVPRLVGVGPTSARSVPATPGEPGHHPVSRRRSPGSGDGDPHGARRRRA